MKPLPLAALVVWGMSLAQAEAMIPGALKVIDFTGTDYLFFGEALRYVCLFSHADYQLNALMGPCSDKRRILEKNIWGDPDSAFIELTLQHRLKPPKNLEIQFRAVWANSISTRIDGAYLTPTGYAKHGVSVLQGFHKQEQWERQADGVSIPTGRQGVTLVMPLFTAWVWAGLPEWPAEPPRAPDRFPGLHLRLSLQHDPASQVHGLLGASLNKVNSSRPLVCNVASTDMPAHIWSAFRPKNAASGEFLGRHEGKESDYQVTGPLAANFKWNAFEGQAREQAPAAFEARVARLKATGSALGL